ncbi:E3 ubiquitin-protein ligase TRIM7-like [Xenopus tropicalis]|uniref:E3 ubiquitin-protein ligase TRIM7-like n=1 Tax=Xenopus tropicalis TaxID=8364 RepID=A0A8J1J8F6_XENTR|nr:E3 ubiquitin-protein ligase TRIM7-like [Xenopus tropicalis]
MATAEPRDELSCSICRGKCADPVTLPCGHNFCQGCIGAAWDSQGGSGAYSCPECRAEYPERPALPRNRTLGNIAARLLTIAPEPGESGTLCTYCVHSPVPAAKSCLHCEASLCDTHLLGHSQSEKHILTAPTRSFGERKCPQHDELLTYYCPQDSACVCAHCCQIGGHRGHRVELLSEASEKKKETLRKVLEKLSPEREETEGQIQRLQERRREGAEVAAGETERVIALFRGIREELEALEKRLLSDISRQKEKLSLPLTELIQQLEIKRDELSRKIRHIEGLCNMAAPLTVLQERESLAFCGAEGADNGGREGIKAPAVPDLDVGGISETLLTGLAGIVSGVRRGLLGQGATDLFLDTSVAGNYLFVSGDGKAASYSLSGKCHPQSPERFLVPQTLSRGSFSSGRHHWEVEGSEFGIWMVGVAYPNIKRGGKHSCIGDNDKSWGLYRCYDTYAVMHDGKGTTLTQSSLRGRIRVLLDYEAGRLSFYELSEPIRHLHTFSASFTEPLHAAFWVGWDDAWVRVIA